MGCLIKKNPTGIWNLPGPAELCRADLSMVNAPDEKTANQLIDQVKYEQVVQWLGDNPHWYEKAVRAWVQTSAGVFVAVLESSGLALILCLGLGGTIGTLLFRHRRRLQKQAALYSDAGGMVRLDLEETTQTTRQNRLLTEQKRPRVLKK